MSMRRQQLEHLSIERRWRLMYVRQRWQALPLPAEACEPRD